MTTQEKQQFAKNISEAFRIVTEAYLEYGMKLLECNDVSESATVVEIMDGLNQLQTDWHYYELSLINRRRKELKNDKGI